MKNQIKQLALAGAAIAMAACSQEIPTNSNVEMNVGEIEISASSGEGSTRTVLNGLATTWVAGDRIGIFSPEAGAVNTPLAAQQAGATSNFRGAFTWGANKHSFVGYYPYQTGAFAATAVPVDNPTYQYQAKGNDVSHLAKLDKLVATPVSDVAAGGAVSLNFSHAFSVFEFRAKGTGYVAEVAAGVVTEEEGTLTEETVKDGTATGGTKTRAAADVVPLSFYNATIDITQAKPSAGVPYKFNYSDNGSEDYDGDGIPDGNNVFDYVILNLEEPAKMTEDAATTPGFYMVVNPVDLTGKKLALGVRTTGAEDFYVVEIDGTNIERGKKYTFVINMPAAPENVLDFVPDNNFRQALMWRQKEWDADNNGLMSKDEAKTVEQLDLYANYISSLSGIEYFTGLKWLNAAGLQLSNVDLSANTDLETVQLYDNYELAELTLGTHEKLIELDIDNTKISALNLAGAPNLIQLTASRTGLRSLDLSKNTKLHYLGFEQNKLTSLDLSKNVDLVGFSMRGNLLTSINLSANVLLTEIDLMDNRLTTIDVSKLPLLKYLYVGVNELTGIDISKNANLEYFYCEANPGRCSPPAAGLSSSRSTTALRYPRVSAVRCGFTTMRRALGTTSLRCMNLLAPQLAAAAPKTSATAEQKR